MRVFVYYNLHKHLWSVKAMEGPFKGRVVAHMQQLHINNATFKVSEAGRQRVLRELRKNVHAGVVGELGSHQQDYANIVTYNPYRCESFYDKNTLKKVSTATNVSFNGRKVTYE